jgi:Sap, sulfolipid-1-addressing protein
MWGTVLVFALIAAMDPVRIGVTALLISRPRPIPNLFIFWLGGLVSGLAHAVVALFLLRDFIFPVVRVVASAIANPIVPFIQIIVGVLALPAAAMIAMRSPARQAAHASLPDGDAAVLVLTSKTPTFFSRLSWREKFDSGSLGTAFVAGLCSATTPVEYWAAIMVVIGSGAAVAAQFGAAMMFTFVALAIAEIPLLSYLVSPAKTQTVVQNLHDWLRVHRRRIVALMLALFGVFLLAMGVGQI